MSNNLKSVTPYIEEDYNNSTSKCNNCKAQGTHEIYKREEISCQITEDLIYTRTVKNVSYYLCDDCFNDVWGEKCPDCGSVNTRRDQKDLELVCLKCGYVINSYVPEPKPKPITRYGTYNKPEYDLYFNKILDLTTANYINSWISYISIDDFVIIINPINPILEVRGEKMTDFVKEHKEHHSHKRRNKNIGRLIGRKSADTILEEFTDFLDTV